jgi:drug/metabolite transporter (DMT)-like permease
MPGNLRGGLWMLMGGFCFSCALAIAKNLAGEIHPFELNLFRCVFGLIAMAPLLFLRGGSSIFRTRRPGLLIGRGLFGGVGQVCVYYALAFLPLAVVTSITFTRPLFLVVLALIFLGEVVRWRRWSAILIGFVGVLIVARPVIETVTLPLAVLVFSTLCHAIAHVFLKKSTGIDDPKTVVFYYLVISTLVGTVPTLYVWTTPDLVQFVWLALSGILYVIGQGFITLGFRAGEATAVAPFDYARILYAIGFDVALFSLYPDVWTLAGTAVIIGATLYIARRGATVEQVRGGPPRR